MKFVIGFVVLVVLIGSAYGLAKLHVIPLDGIAKSSPIAAKLLNEMKLLPPTPKAPIVAAAPAVTVDPYAAEKQQLAAQQAQINQEKQQLAMKPVVAAVPPPPPIVPTAPQLIEIYEAMNSDDLATLFAKQPDSAVVSALIGMDTKKAAKALAAMPPDRGAKITAMMNRSMAMAANTPQPTTP